MKNQYDIIVVGIGGMGSSALLHLAKRGIKVCGLEQFKPGHDRGSTHGDSRIVRKAYFLDPSYVPLMHRSYELMGELEQHCGEKLFHNVGLLSAGVIGSPFHRGMERCFATHGLPHECWTTKEAKQHYPQIHLPEDSVIYFDPAGGYANPEAVVLAHTRSAIENGATLLTEERMLDWKANGNGVEVKTSRQTLHADKIILTTGGWIIPELQQLGISMSLKRKVQVWFSVKDIQPFLPENCPVFILKNNDGDFYGFPTLDGKTIKTAETSGGTDLESADHQHDRLLPEDYENLTRFMKNTFGDLIKEHVQHKECLQTFTDDQNFIVDTHPAHSQVILCSPCSGHGFKFVPVMGELLANMSEGKPQQLDISLFKINRFLK